MGSAGASDKVMEPQTHKSKEEKAEKAAKKALKAEKKAEKEKTTDSTAEGAETKENNENKAKKAAKKAKKVQSDNEDPEKTKDSENSVKKSKKSTKEENITEADKPSKEDKPEATPKPDAAAAQAYLTENGISIEVPEESNEKPPLPMLSLQSLTRSSTRDLRNKWTSRGTSSQHPSRHAAGLCSCKAAMSLALLRQALARLWLSVSRHSSTCCRSRQSISKCL